MCGCTNDTCFGGCPCGCNHTGPANVRYLRDRRGFVGVPNPENHDASARPVVVIDPEDREQVERLHDLVERWDSRVPYVEFAEEGDLTGVTALQAALREFAKPKPEEPTGLGAVVEDDKGDRWTRIECGALPQRNQWVCAADEQAVPRSWDRITAVRVLSEGVQP